MYEEDFVNTEKVREIIENFEKGKMTAKDTSEKLFEEVSNFGGDTKVISQKSEETGDVFEVVIASYISDYDANIVVGKRLLRKEDN